MLQDLLLEIDGLAPGPPIAARSLRLSLAITLEHRRFLEVYLTVVEVDGPVRGGFSYRKGNMRIDFLRCLKWRSMDGRECSPVVRTHFPFSRKEL